MSKIMTYILAEVDAGRMYYDETAGEYKPVKQTKQSPAVNICDHCGIEYTETPIETAEGEYTCQQCFERQLEYAGLRVRP